MVQKFRAGQDEFLATLAHELRNPLAPISSAIQLLGRTNEPREKQPQVLEMIARNVQHMTRMVDDLLEVSRITRGKIELKKEWADIAQLVRNAAETSGPSIQAGGHHLTVSVQPSGLEVYVDSVRLTQVVANLLNNAAKFTPFGGRIEVIVERAGSCAVLKVRDYGPGIPDERLRDIFDLFTQVHVEQRQSGGLGIGLALVKRLIELHDGTVEACHAEGGGAEFIVQIPIAAIAPGEQEHKKQGEIATAASSSRRILIVDDNADAADSLAMLVSAEGHLIATAYDGGSAIEKAFTFNPHLIFLDLGMPGMDGFATAKRIRSLPGTSHIRIVALTGWGQERDRLGTRIAGFQNHLVKPVQLSDLQRVIQEADSISNRKDFDAVEVEPTLPKSMENVSEATDRQSPATVPEEADRRDSKVAHDFANCFFGIRMAAELLKRLEISEPSIQNQVQRVVDSMEHDCEEGEGLIETIRRLMQ